LLEGYLYSWVANPGEPAVRLTLGTHPGAQRLQLALDRSTGAPGAELNAGVI